MLAVFRLSCRALALGFWSPARPGRPIRFSRVPPPVSRKSSHRRESLRAAKRLLTAHGRGAQVCRATGDTTAGPVLKEHRQDREKLAGRLGTTAKGHQDHRLAVNPVPAGLHRGPERRQVPVIPDVDGERQDQRVALRRSRTRVWRAGGREVRHEDHDLAWPAIASSSRARQRGVRLQDVLHPGAARYMPRAHLQHRDLPRFAQHLETRARMSSILPLRGRRQT